MTLTYLAAFAAAFCFVGLRSFQQTNVIKRKYLWIIPTSFMMAAVEVKLIQQMSHNDWGWIVLWIGAGGGLGSVTAVWIHERFLR
jgi:hypothetical protein